MKAVVAAFNQEKALVGAFSVITNLRMELFEALVTSLTMTVTDSPGLDAAVAPHVGAAVRARDVEQRDPLQLRALRQLQRLVVTLNNGKYLDISSVLISYCRYINKYFFGKLRRAVSGFR